MKYVLSSSKPVEQNKIGHACLRVILSAMPPRSLTSDGGVAPGCRGTGAVRDSDAAAGDGASASATNRNFQQSSIVLLIQGRREGSTFVQREEG